MTFVNPILAMAASIVVIGLGGGCVCHEQTDIRDRIDVERVFGEPDAEIQQYGDRQTIRSGGRSSNSRLRSVPSGNEVFPWHERILVYRARDLEVVIRDGEVLRVAAISEPTKRILEGFDRDGLSEAAVDQTNQ